MCVCVSAHVHVCVRTPGSYKMEPHKYLLLSLLSYSLFFFFSSFFLLQRSIVTVKTKLGMASMERTV